MSPPGGQLVASRVATRPPSAVPPASRSAREAQPLVSLPALVRRAPVTVVLTIALWVVGAVTGSLSGRPSPELKALVGIGLSTLEAGHWWTLLSGVLWCAGPAGYVVSTVLLLGLVAPAEYRLGSVRTAALLVGSHVAGSAIAVALVAAATATGTDWAMHLATHVALGPSGAAVGVALAASTRWGALWRRRGRVGLLAVTAMPALYSGSLDDIVRLMVALAGLELGTLALGRRRQSRAWAASAPEIRLLVAAVVAASALGPLLAALSGTAIGPLSVLRLVVLPPPPDPSAVAMVCTDPANLEDCVGLQYRLRLGGIGPAIMSVLPVLVLLVLADGLRRGRRFAWRAATGLNVGFASLGAGLAVVTASNPAERLAAFGGAGDRQFYTGVATSILQPLVVVVLLWITASRFTVRAPVRAWRAPAALVGLTFVAVSATYLVGSLIVRDQYAPAPGWPALLADLPTRFLPPGYLGELEIAFLPVGPVATALYEWIGVIFWAVTLGAVVWLLRRTRTVTGDPAEARDLLIRHGGSTLSWQATWAGNSFWFSPDRRAAIAYRVIGGVALTTGEPFGNQAARAAAIDGFAEFCARHAWTPCLYSVGDAVRDHTRTLGWDSVQVAEETLVPLTDLSFTGKKWQDIRTALNNAAKAGVTAEWITYSEAPLAITDQIRAISEEWVADKGLPEMGFTLGGLDELADDRVRCLIAVDAERTVHGVTSWLPVIREPEPTDDIGEGATDDGPVDGWTLDFMRRRDVGPGTTAPRGVTEFLIASAILTFQAEGALVASLSGAPLARLDRGARPDALQRLLDLSGRTLEPVYGFRSLLRFKAKFQPTYRPLYMTYPDAAALPAIATAITRAYLPRLRVSQSLRLMQQLRRRGAATG